MDTPETKRPGYTEACRGGQATAFATTTLLNQRVAVIVDASQNAHDRYGRTQVHPDCNGKSLGVGRGRGCRAQPHLRLIPPAAASTRGRRRGGLSPRGRSRLVGSTLLREHRRPAALARAQATRFRILCLGGGSGSLILVSCRLARWWLRSVRCWAARIRCSVIHRPPGKDPPRAR
ncbi:MAG: hypothetical protein U1D00_31380 [Mycobacterium sp.]|nr:MULTISPECIES: hypothetical protein [Mycolicibacterium]MCG7583464.1 hypothetical protein [Mycolicibacterium sp. OfavD-34-C]MDZ4270132.1 hypothetical protein [Mycobacterium sp.]